MQLSVWVSNGICNNLYLFQKFDIHRVIADGHLCLFFHFKSRKACCLMQCNDCDFAEDYLAKCTFGPAHICRLWGEIDFYVFSLT